jgi:hypothetical protein
MNRLNLRRWLWFTGISLLTANLVLGGRAVMPWERMFPDYITYWTAGSLVAKWQSPYDVDSQVAIQRELGWDRSINGRGVLAFLPYYYPPWFALACTLLVPMGYEGGKLAWFFLNLELLFLTGFLLRDAVPGLPRSIPLLAVPLFLLALLALLLGQTTIVMAFLCAVVWRLLDHGWDRAAGVVLACLSTKPQLAAVLVLALGLWAVRRQRWGVVQGFALTMALLCFASTLIVPSWPREMLAATRRTLPPTEHFPWLGNAWFLVLKALGLRGWALWILYIVVAVLVLGSVLRAALDRGRPLLDVMSLGLLAAFFVTPYARHYDFVVLLIPAFVLIGTRLSENAGGMLLMTLIIVPYLQFMVLVRYSRLVVPNVDFFLECTFFWIPVLLAVLWFATRQKRQDVLTTEGTEGYVNGSVTSESTSDLSGSRPLNQVNLH